MSKKINGIVLKQMDYRENDIIIKVLSEENGIVSFVVKGAKKPNSKNMVACRQFCLSEFIYNESANSDLHGLRTATLMKSYLADSLEDISLQSVFTEIIDKNYNSDNFEDIYNLLRFSLDNLNKRYLTACFFIARILELQGFSPYVDGCVNCDNKQIVGLSESKGGFVCMNCKESNEFMEINRLKKFRLINKASLKDFEKIRDYDYDLEDFRKIMNFYLYQTGQKIFAYDLIANIL